jgi:hypothetical protein
MCNYYQLQILTSTDITTLLQAHYTVQKTYPTRTLAQQLATVARDF